MLWVLSILVRLCAMVPMLEQQGPIDPYPSIVTAKTRHDPATLARLEARGSVIFADGFDAEASLKSCFEVLGQPEGHASITPDSANVRSGKGSLKLTSKAAHGGSSGAGPVYWLGNEGYDRIHIRYYIKFAADYDQGNLNHTGGGLHGVAGTNKWFGLGSAGLRPKGDDHFSSRFEPWRDWGKHEAPGRMFCYAYWMDMKIDRDGHYWGNMLEPDLENRIVPQRGRWYCMEQMIKCNTPGRSDGELAAWIDGKLYLHAAGFRWRSTDAVKIKRANLSIYVHQARKDNTVWYDDFAVSTGYIGPTRKTVAAVAKQ